MASEISVVAQITATKGNKTISRSRSFQADWALAREALATQNIPTTAAGTALTVHAGVTTPGVSYFMNQDPTNYCELGIQQAGTFYPLVKLKPYEMWIMRIAVGPTAIFARANTNAIDLEFGILQD